MKVCAPNGRCAFAPVWDVGPWNTRDDYWNPGDQRQEWRDLPQGLPQAQAAFEGDYNGGRDQYQREVANPAGIDLGDGLFWDALGLKDNSWVTVDYLWTGSIRLSSVESDEPVDVLAAPDAAAEVVGVAADRAAVPVECALATGEDTWLRIGLDQYVGAGSVPDAGDIAPCSESGDEPSSAPAQDAEEPSGTSDEEPDTTAGGIVTDVVDNTLGAPTTEDPAQELPAQEDPAQEESTGATPAGGAPSESATPESATPESAGTESAGTGPAGTEQPSAGIDPPAAG